MTYQVNRYVLSLVTLIARLTVKGAVSPSADDSSKASAIMIKPKTDAAIEDITVANCHITGYGHALHIRQHSHPISVIRALSTLRQSRAGTERYPRHHVSSLNSINSGIFVGDHVRREL